MKNQKMNKLKSKIRKAIAGGLVGVLSVLPIGCGSNNKLIDKNLIKKPYAETAFVSDLVTKHGFIFEGQNRQDFINVNLNDNLSAFIWQTYSHKDDAVHERDFGISYNIPINDKLSIRVGGEYWDYPSGTFGEYDGVIKAGANYAGPIDLDFDVTQLVGHDATQSGTRYYLKASKNFPLGKIAGADVSVKPSISTALIDNYYARTGHSQITPGISVGAKKGNLSLNFFINKQDGRMPGFKDHTWYGLSLGYGF